MSQAELKKLYSSVQRRVKDEEDNVRFYWLTPQAVAQVLVIGGNPPQPPPTVYIV